VAFYLDEGTDRVLAPNARIVGNTADTGYAGGVKIYNAEYSGFLDLTGSRFISNTAGSDGGGLYEDGYFYYGVTILLNGTEFLTNTAGSGGGGAYFSDGPEYGSRLELSGARFISNTATSGDGGGLYVGGQYYDQAPTEEPSTLADHMVFERNRASGSGGGAYFDYMEEGVHVILDDSTWLTNTAGSDGGGLYLDYVYEGAYLSVSRSRFEGNEAGSDGGGLHFDYAEYGAYAYFDNNRFAHNQADGDGGGFHCDAEFSYDGSLASFSGNTVVGNTAGGEGGGVWMDYLAYDGGEAFFDDNWIEGNRSNGDGGGAVLGDSYAAYDGAIAHINGNHFVDNVAEDGYGAGVYLYYINDGCRVEFQDNVVSGNVISSTTDYGGGGVYLYDLTEGSVLWMTGNEIEGNVATGYGGGLYWDDVIDYGSTLYFEDNEVEGNWVDGDGGGCDFEDSINDGSNLYFNGNRVNDNVATGDGGGCLFDAGFVDGNIVDFQGNEFNGNTAGGDYGALYVYDVDDGTLVRFWENEVIGNRAGISETVLIDQEVEAHAPVVLGGDGGGVYLNSVEYGSEMRLWDNRIEENTATLTDTIGGRYGGLYAILGADESGNPSITGKLVLLDNEIEENEAQDSYGGVYVEMYEESQLVMVHNVIRANEAVTESGGAYIYGENDSQYFLRRNQIVANKAGSQGGLWLENGDTTDPLWGLMENNLVADNVGSGVYAYDVDLWITNDTIANNGAYGIKMAGSGTISTTAHVSNTIVWGNTKSFVNDDPANVTFLADYSDVKGSWPGTGNLNVNPQFVNAGAGDYHLKSTSPAIDKADAAVAPAIDLDGVPRPVGPAPDMGCYEWRLVGVELEPDLDVEVNPGEEVTLHHAITNTGNAQDTFTLTVKSASGWPVEVTPEEVTLGPGGSAPVQVVVEVPGGLLAGVMDAITVTARSEPNPTAVDAAYDELTVALVPALTFQPDRAAGAPAGTLVVYQHTLTNESNGPETFLLSKGSSLGWTVTISPAVAILDEGEAATVKVRVSIPSGAPVGAEDVTTVTATSLTDSGVSASVKDTTTREASPYVLYFPIAGRNFPPAGGSFSAGLVPKGKPGKDNGH
jgi:hypothetical protein